jgi:hypothetical protein
MYNKIICSMCGEEIDSSSLYCPKCGEKISKSKVNIENEITEYKKKMFRENRGWFIYLGLILILSISMALYSIIPDILENLSPRNPIILYLSATIVYLIDLYTFQYKKKFNKAIYYSLLLFSISYAIFFAVMMYEPNGDFMTYIAPVFTIVMIFSPFIIGRKNISIR